MKRKLVLFTVIATLLSFMIAKDACCVIDPVLIEFLYYEPCSTCPGARKYYEAYLHNSRVVAEIQEDYGDKVVVNRIPFFSDEGLKKVEQYNLSLGDWNSIVVNQETVLLGGDKLVNETYLRQIIDSYLEQCVPVSDTSMDASAAGLLVTAFILGFFETFSPCLIIMLSFIASYTFGSGVEFREGFTRIMIFGAGFVSATAIIGLAFGLILFSVPTLHSYLMLAVCAFAIIFGLHLLGLLKLPSLIQTKPLIRKIARKYVSVYSVYIGIFLLGFIFYFLDPCIAPIFASMASILFSEVFLLGMLIFCIGAMIPFIGIGLFTSSISKITRKVYRYRHIFRGISGLILLGYALYLIFIFIPYLV